MCTELHAHPFAQVFAMPIQSIMIACDKPKEVLTALNDICNSLLNKDSLPRVIPFKDDVLRHEQFRLCLKLLGFTENQQQEHWICDAGSVADEQRIYGAIYECDRRREEVNLHMDMSVLIQQFSYQNSRTMKLSMCQDLTQQADSFEPAQPMARSIVEEDLGNEEKKDNELGHYPLDVR